MKTQLETLVKQADLLGHDFDPARDNEQVSYLSSLLGMYYPICVLEKVIGLYKEELRHIENELIPDLILEEGLASVETTDGLQVSLKTEYTVATVDPESMYEWGESVGAGHLWKQSLKFDKGEDILAVEEVAQAQGLSYEKKSEIHWQTLKKVVKDYIEGGGSPEDIPETAGKVSMFTHAVIKRGK